MKDNNGYPIKENEVKEEETTAAEYSSFIPAIALAVAYCILQLNFVHSAVATQAAQEKRAPSSNSCECKR